MTALLEVRDLRVEIRGKPPLRVVDGVSLSVDKGEFVGLVGESGCGKTMTAFSIMNLFPTPAARIAGGSVTLDGSIRLDTMPAGELRHVRGARIGMVFQDPHGFLDPLMPVGAQIAETLTAHGHDGDIEARVRELIGLMELPDAANLARRYPHELSGGQRQRVLIAAALAMNPSLLIADEPTTALDVTIQASIIDLLRKLRARLGLGVLLITHDLGVVAETCDRVYVMYAGRVVETNATAPLFAAPRHPYTQGLLRGTMSVAAPPDQLFAIPGTVPEPRAMPSGCRFNPRCPAATDQCRREDPRLVFREGSGADACWRGDEPMIARTWAQAASAA